MLDVFVFAVLKVLNVPIWLFVLPCFVMKTLKCSICCGPHILTSFAFELCIGVQLQNLEAWSKVHGFDWKILNPTKMSLVVFLQVLVQSMQSKYIKCSKMNFPSFEKNIFWKIFTFGLSWAQEANFRNVAKKQHFRCFCC